MRSTLEAFWYNKIEPGNCNCWKRADYKETIQSKKQIWEQLCSGLSSEQATMLERFNECHINEMGILTREIFIDAFRLGMRFMLESLSDEQ